MTAQAVLYAHDPGPLATFYRDCLGLTLAESGDDHCELHADDFVLWLVRGQAPAPQADHDGSVRRRSTVPLKLGLEVKSIESVVGTIETFGGSVAETGWEFAGYRRRDAVDPEGNVIQLLEPLTP